MTKAARPSRIPSGRSMTGAFASLGLSPHQAGRRRVEAEPDREQDVDREVDPEDLQRRQRDAVRDVEDAGPEEQEDERRPA